MKEWVAGTVQAPTIGEVATMLAMVEQAGDLLPPSQHQVVAGELDLVDPLVADLVSGQRMTVPPWVADLTMVALVSGVARHQQVPCKQDPQAVSTFHTSFQHHHSLIIRL